MKEATPETEGRLPDSRPAEPVCPEFQAAIELIGKRWSGAIVSSLSSGPVYFAGLAHAVPGVSDRVLSERLRELEAAGIVERSVHAGNPPRVSYRLSAIGTELEPALAELASWARRWQDARRIGS